MKYESISYAYITTINYVSRVYITTQYDEVDALRLKLDSQISFIFTASRQINFFAFTFFVG